jgi:hypothetical protein
MKAKFLEQPVRRLLGLLPNGLEKTYARRNGVAVSVSGLERAKSQGTVLGRPPERRSEATGICSKPEKEGRRYRQDRSISGHWC